MKHDIASFQKSTENLIDPFNKFQDKYMIFVDRFKYFKKECKSDFSSPNDRIS